MVITRSFAGGFAVEAYGSIQLCGWGSGLHMWNLMAAILWKPDFIACILADYSRHEAKKYGSHARSFERIYRPFVFAIYSPAGEAAVILVCRFYCRGDVVKGLLYKLQWLWSRGTMNEYRPFVDKLPAIESNGYRSIALVMGAMIVRLYLDRWYCTLLPLPSCIGVIAQRMGYIPPLSWPPWRALSTPGAAILVIRVSRA